VGVHGKNREEKRKKKKEKVDLTVVDQNSR
jgi:hypothetical protein